jgi:hypothetical protein
MQKGISMHQISFTNQFGVPVALEIRSGSNACDQNTQRYSNTLAAGGTYTLNTDDNVVCYRRTSNPDDPDSGFTVWNTFSPDDDNTPVTITL